MIKWNRFSQTVKINELFSPATLASRVLYYKKLTNDVMNSIVLHFYADINRNANSRTFSRDIHFEVKYLENGLVIHISFFSVLESFSYESNTEYSATIQLKPGPN